MREVSFLSKDRKAINKKLRAGKITEEQAEAEARKLAAAEESPAPVETTDDLLREIRDLLKAQNASASSNVPQDKD